MGERRRLPFCPDCGKGFLGTDECIYCGTELVEPDEDD